MIKLELKSKQLKGLNNLSDDKFSIANLTRSENGKLTIEKNSSDNARSKGGQNNKRSGHMSKIGKQYGSIIGKKYGKQNGIKVAATGLGTKAAVEITKTSIEQLTLDGKHIKYWDKMNDCKRAGYSISSISRCCNGIAKSANGYLWKFKNK
jgi:hypothetical protein